MSLKIGEFYGIDFEKFRKEIYENDKTCYRITHFYPFKKGKKYRLSKIQGESYSSRLYLWFEDIGHVTIRPSAEKYFIPKDKFIQEELDV